MSDLAYIDRTNEVKIAGQDATGLGVNFVTADANGNMFVKDYSDGPVTPGTVASASALAGGQFNTTLPTLTNTQQSAIQLDASGRLIISTMQDKSGTGTIAAINQSVAIATSGYATTTVSTTGTWVGILIFEYSNDNGTTWWEGTVHEMNVNGVQVPLFQFGANDAGMAEVGGWTNFRIRASTWTSGTANITLNNSVASQPNRNWSLDATLDTIGAEQFGYWKVGLTVPSGDMDVGYGTVGIKTLRTAAQLGNATGAALFGAGTTTAQVLRVVLPTDQTAIPATQSGAWTTGRTWTLASGTDSVSVVQSTSPWVTKDQADGPVTPGTVASFSELVGGQFNTVLPTLTNTQQSAIQLDSSGRIIVRNSELPATVDTNYGAVGASTIRTASQIGNATGAANFNAGATGAQTLRVAANLYDSAGNGVTSTLDGSNRKLNVNTPDSTSTGSIAASGNSVSFICSGLNTAIVNIGGAWSGGTLQFEFSQDGTQFWSVEAYEIGSTFVTAPLVTAAVSTNHSGVYSIPCAGYLQIRVRASALASGTVTVAFDASIGSQYLPVVNTTAANFQTTASQGGTWNINNISGTVSLPTGAATAANQTTLGSQTTKINDGTNTAAVKAASTAPLATDPALVVTLSPNSSPLIAATGSGTISALNGTVVAVGGSAVTWSLSGTWVGTVITQAQSGDGQWWNVASLSNQSGLITTGTSINGVLEMNGAGWIQVRLLATAWTSGTVTATWNSTTGSHVIIPYSSNAANMLVTSWLNDGVGNSISSASGSLLVKDNSDGPVTPGTVATNSSLIGGQFNTALPTLTNTQQSAIQLDSSGRLIIRPLTSTDVVSAVQSGTWTVQQGTPPWTVQGDSASGASKAGNPVQIGGVFNTTQPTVTTGQTVEAQSTARGALIVSTGVDSFNINNISGTVSLPTGAATAANQATEITSLQSIDNPVGSVAAGTAGTSSFLTGGVFNTSLPTVTNGQQVATQLDSSGRIIVSPGLVVSTKTALTASSPTAATVGVASGVVIASNANRKGLVLTNTSKNTISFGIGVAAVLNSGITLTSNGSWVMDEFTFTTGAINGIASAASSNVAIQEFTT